jgi:hypothetical protein
MAGKAIYRAEDGTETDITNAVTILWDGVVNSLDWGSGFWDAEDAGAVAWIGRLFNFEVPSNPDGLYHKDGWTVTEFSEAIKRYEQHRAEIDANLPELP